MNMKNLFNGVAIVIDDEAGSSANIKNILDQIETHNIPLLIYKEIPPKETINHFQNLSFLLLDWRLVKEEISNEKFEDKVHTPDHLEKYEASQNIDFIKKLKKVCFCPIFIFTNESVNDIEIKLESEGLYKKDIPNHIFIMAKSDLQGDSTVFKKVESWLKNTPSVYVLKEWEREYQKCKNKLFSEFQDLSPFWPKIMWQSFGDDGANKSLELGELISRNIHNRMTPFEFNNELLNHGSHTVDRDELRKVLEGERFLKNLHADVIGTGDVFKEKYQEREETKYRYFLNIRAQCDLMRASDQDKVELYCLKGRVIDEDKINQDNGHHVVEGQFIEKACNAVIPFIDNGLIIEFLFKDIHIKKWKDLKDNRIGRILPPYINKIQQRYALYMQREGLPRIPDAAIHFPKS